MAGLNTKSILLHISQNVTLPMADDTAAKWLDIMAPSASDGNIVHCVNGSALPRESPPAQLVGAAMRTYMAPADKDEMPRQGIEVQQRGIG
jgi:hypothetical protein